MSPLWTLIPLGAAWGIISTIVFRRFSNAAAIRTAVNRMLAHILEFRLFLDEPKLVLRAQRDLFRVNGRLLRAIAVPTVILAIPLALAFPALDAEYGHGPLEPGKAFVITARTTAADAQLKAPGGVMVETPPVRAVQGGEVSWRVRPISVFFGKFEVLNAAGAAAEVPYPRANIAGLPWWIWFGLSSAIAFRYLAIP